MTTSGKAFFNRNLLRRELQNPYKKPEIQILYRYEWKASIQSENICEPNSKSSHVVTLHASDV